MEEERNRGKEYYQVNLDMGRLFWIAFLIGVILISVFIFGFFIGGDRGETRNKRDLLKLDTSELFNRERMRVEQARDELKILDLFDTDLEAETRYIDVKSLEESVEETAVALDVPAPAEHTRTMERPEPAPVHVQTPPAREKTVYRPVGDYYIQVASFTEEANAEKMAKKLQKNLYKVEIEKAMVQDKAYYRVQVGPFERQSVATNTMMSMKRIFKLSDPFVLKKQS